MDGRHLTSVYSLSEVEQLALPEFLDENLKNQFTHPSTDAPLKKDESPRLTISTKLPRRIGISYHLSLVY
jgi:hypothetical protein